jgi:heme a synthase
MVFAMIIIGAITRLSESGLSITQWKPVTGALPPLSEGQWQAEFDLYKQSPEFIKKNSWMALSDFKSIFFWEWLHRLWGRLIGLVFGLPLLVFWLRGMIPRGYGYTFLGLLALGGAQGFVGWYMVASGLIDVPAVSHYRLAAHLLLALFIMQALLATGFAIGGVRRHPDRALFIHAAAALALLSVTILWGAFTAGLDAGLIYNDSFPLMGGQWMPPDFWAKGPLLANVTENHSAVQFTHRWLAISSVVMILSLWAHALARHKTLPALHAAAGLSVLQAGLGIATLFSGVNLHVAATHQAGAVILLSLLTLALYQSRPQQDQASAARPAAQT